MLNFGFVLSLVALVSAQVGPGQLIDFDNGVHTPGAIPNNAFEPIEQRLAYSGATAMVVSWNTYAQLSKPTVTFGLSPSNLNLSASSNVSVTYPTSRTYNNHVKLSGLTPNTKYWYKTSYHNCARCAYLPLFSFTTARAAGDETPFVLAMIVEYVRRILIKFLELTNDQHGPHGLRGTHHHRRHGSGEPDRS